jgi:hypothetical protein
MIEVEQMPPAAHIDDNKKGSLASNLYFLIKGLCNNTSSALTSNYWQY